MPEASATFPLIPNPEIRTFIFHSRLLHLSKENLSFSEPGELDEARALGSCRWHRSSAPPSWKKQS